MRDEDFVGLADVGLSGATPPNMRDEDSTGSRQTGHSLSPPMIFGTHSPHITRWPHGSNRVIGATVQTHTARAADFQIICRLSLIACFEQSDEALAETANAIFWAIWLLLTWLIRSLTWWLLRRLRQNSGTVCHLSTSNHLILLRYHIWHRR